MNVNLEELFIREGTSQNAFWGEILDESCWKKERLVYVGVKRKDNKIVYCYPKYLNSNESELGENEKQYIKKHMHLIIRVIDKLRDSGKNIESGDNVFDPTSFKQRKNVDRMSLALFIINNYIRSGVYTVNEYETGLFSNGKVSWGKTVAKVSPIIDGNNIIYPNQIKKRKTTNDSNIITKLHYYIVGQCLEYLSDRGIEKRIYISRNVYLGDNLKKYVEILNGELTRVFADRERALLKALISWCDISPYYKESSGTTNFELVWEWINDAIWGNVEYKQSDAPEYRFINERQYSGRGEQIPDTLCIDLNNKNRTCKLDIFDAKYYVPGINYNNNQITGMPASSDISKQVGYRLFLDTFINGINKEYENMGEEPYKVEFSNHFLIPKSDTILSYMDIEFSDNELYKECGFVSVGTFSRLLSYFENLAGKEKKIMDSFSEKDLMNVGIVVVNPEILYNSYLKNPVESVKLA